MDFDIERPFRKNENEFSLMRMSVLQKNHLQFLVKVAVQTQNFALINLFLVQFILFVDFQLVLSQVDIAAGGHQIEFGADAGPEQIFPSDKIFFDAFFGRKERLRLFSQPNNQPQKPSFTYFPSSSPRPSS